MPIGPPSYRLDPKSACIPVSRPIELMLASELGSRDNESTRRFQMLSAGKRGQPPGKVPQIVLVQGVTQFGVGSGPSLFPLFPLSPLLPLWRFLFFFLCLCLCFATPTATYPSSPSKLLSSSNRREVTGSND